MQRITRQLYVLLVQPNSQKTKVCPVNTYWIYPAVFKHLGQGFDIFFIFQNLKYL